MEAAETPSVDAVLRDEANFIQNVSQFYNQEALHDIVLKVGDQNFYGHKFVLAKSSDVFRTMLYERGGSKEATDEIELSESVECQAVFDNFLRYLYTAEVSISTQSAVGILCLADKYNVVSLKELCIQYMVENVRSPNVRNALNWYPWAKALHLDTLIQHCTQTIAWNYNEIIISPEWLQMDLEFLCDMLQSSELVIANEFSLWEALSSWLLQESHVTQLKENTSRLLPLIRFPQMQVPQLYVMEQAELARHEACKDLLLQLLSQAYRFRALCPAQTVMEPKLSFNEPYYMPREYTDLTVDSVRMQNTLRFGIQVDIKMYKGPVPQETREADWKITYRKQMDTWQLQLYCHESGLVNNEARIQASILIFNENDKVIQMNREPTMVVTRGNSVNVVITIKHPSLAKTMSILIKPVPS